MIRSLHFRLIVVGLFILLAFVIVTGLVLENAFLGTARLAMQERMLGQLYLFVAAADIDPEGRFTMPLPTELPDPQLALSHSGLYAFVVDGQQRLLWQSPSSSKIRLPQPFELQLGEKRFATVRLKNDGEFLMLGFALHKSTALGGQLYRYYVMSDLEPVNQQISYYRHRLWGGIAIMTLFLSLLQGFLFAWGLRPLREVRQELSAIELGQQRLLNRIYPIEIKRLADNINSLLEQERARQTRYRNAMADLAHSLKTPLAVLHGMMGRDQSSSSPAHEQLMRMQHIIERQLQRASTAGRTNATAQVAIYPIVGRIINSLEKVYHEKDIVVSNLIDQRLHFMGDEMDMMEIFGNLLDNAYKWCSKTITIDGYYAANSIILSVEDDGAGIDSSKLSQILQRGIRADETKPGHGMGLALVSDIVDAYQGQLSFEQGSFGGAKVIIEFPLKLT